MLKKKTKFLVGTFLRKLRILKFYESLEFVSEVSCNFPSPFLINFLFFTNKEFLQEELNQTYILFISGHLTFATKAFQNNAKTRRFKLEAAWLLTLGSISSCLLPSSSEPLNEIKERKSDSWFYSRKHFGKSTIRWVAMKKYFSSGCKARFLNRYLRKNLVV